MSASNRGSLTVVGTGIQLAGHTTLAAKDVVERAEKVYYGVSDPGTARWVRSLNPTAETVAFEKYREGTPRSLIYEDLIEMILSGLRQGLRVCAVFYGHPGIFVNAGHEVIRRARELGYSAGMMPAVSALDCLFADLGVDPGDEGCRIFEARDYLVRRRAHDPTVGLVLFQVGLLNSAGYRCRDRYSLRGVSLLQEFLAERYLLAHEVIAYEAPVYPVCSPIVQHIPLSSLASLPLNAATTLYVPPSLNPPFDEEIRARIDRAASSRSSE